MSQFEEIKDRVRNAGSSAVLGNGGPLYTYLKTRGNDPATCSEAIEAFMATVWPDMKVEITQNDQIRFTALRDGIEFSVYGMFADPYILREGEFLEWSLDSAESNPLSTCFYWLARWLRAAGPYEPLPAGLLAEVIPGANNDLRFNQK